MTQSADGKRRHILITDENYKKVASAAVEKSMSKWKVIDEALKLYFTKEEGERQGE